MDEKAIEKNWRELRSIQQIVSTNDSIKETLYHINTIRHHHQHQSDDKMKNEPTLCSITTMEYCVHTYSKQ